MTNEIKHTPLLWSCEKVHAEPDQDVREARTIICKIAAELVCGDKLPSHYQEDWSIKVPAGVLKSLSDCHDQMRIKASSLKRAYDILGKSLNRPAAPKQGD